MNFDDNDGGINLLSIFFANHRLFDGDDKVALIATKAAGLTTHTQVEDSDEVPSLGSSKEDIK